MKYLTTKITKKYWTSMFSPHVESQVKTKAYQVKRPVSWVYHLTSSLFLIKKLSQAKEKIFYLRCDPWRAGRGQEFGPVGQQLFILGRWYLPEWHDILISSWLTSPKRAADWDVGKIYTLMFCTHDKSNQICNAQKVFTIWNVAHNLDQLVGDLNVVLFSFQI